MPLESLSDEQINIHDLTLEQEKRPKRYEKTKEIFEGLKTERNLWHGEKHDFWYEDEPDGVYTGYQLRAAWVESLFGKDEALANYDWLKSRNYDQKRGEWNWCGLPDFNDPNYSKEFLKDRDGRFSEEQLIDVIIMTQFDKREALQHFSKLSESNFFDKNNGQWISSLDHDGIIKNANRNSKSQLLSVIAEAQFDKQGASNKYSKLKNSSFYDQDSDKWTDIKDDQTTKEPSYQYTAPRLLDVIALSFFDRSSAKEKYQQMKNSGAYDVETDLWWRYSDDAKIFKYHDLNLQMYGALCEYYTAEDQEETISNVPLPETRSY